MSTDRRANKQNVTVHVNGILFSLERKDILSHATTWMNLEGAMLSETQQSQEDEYSTIPRHTRCLEQSNSLRRKTVWPLPGGGVRGTGGWRSMETEFQFGKMRKFWRQRVVTVTLQCGCTYCHRTVHLKMVNHVILRIFNHNENIHAEKGKALCNRVTKNHI